MMDTRLVKSNVKLVNIFVFLSLLLLAQTHGKAQVRVHTYFTGLGNVNYLSAEFALEVEKQLDVDYSASIGLGYRIRTDFLNFTDYEVDWKQIEIPVGFKYFIHPAVGLQLIVAPQLLLSSPTGYNGLDQKITAQSTPRFNTDVGLWILTGGSFFGLFSIPKNFSVGVGLRGAILPQTDTVYTIDTGEQQMTYRLFGASFKLDVTLFNLKRKKL